MYLRSYLILMKPKLFYLLATIVCLIGTMHSYAQDTAALRLAGWGKDIIKIANTGAGVPYMSDEEKQTLLFINLCRMQPRKLAKKYVIPLVDSSRLDSMDPYLLSLLSELEKIKAHIPLNPDKKIHDMARDWCLNIVKTGICGHGDFEGRYKHYTNKGYSVGENCMYTHDGPFQIVLEFLIDDDNETYGHRHNILTVEYTDVGISIEQSKNTGKDCVIDFSGHLKY
jgi:hypothetical protein